MHLASLELHTGDPDSARAVCDALGLDVGVIGCRAASGLWLPYARVEDVDAAAARAEALGGRVLAAPRDNAAGRRALVTAGGVPVAIVNRSVQ